MEKPHQKSLKVVFIVQGEGRGHMTQALALSELLLRRGHQPVHALVGKSARRVIPDFFTTKIGCPVTPFESPNFVTDAGNRGIHMGKTILQTLLRFPVYWRSLRLIQKTVLDSGADLVVNFFDPLAGLWSLLLRPRRLPLVAVAHQYIFNHRGYVFPHGRITERLAIKGYTLFTAAGAARRLALSLYPLPSQGRIRVVPPLLRGALFSLPPACDEGFLLAYTTNSGYLGDIMASHAHTPGQRIECFCDLEGEAPSRKVDDTLTLNRIHDQRYLEAMNRCTGVVATAGFESVAEAAYLGKNYLLIPIENHFEQYCNALDAERAGAGIRAEGFNEIPRFLKHLKEHPSPSPKIADWIRQARTILAEEIEGATSEN